MKRSVYPLYFIIPAVLLYVTFFIIPSLAGIGYSFTDWSSYSDDISFVGMDNFQRIFSPSERYVVCPSSDALAPIGGSISGEFSSPSC